MRIFDLKACIFLRLVAFYTRKITTSEQVLGGGLYSDNKNKNELQAPQVQTNALLNLS